MESALSPNTAAFLDYLSSQLNGNGDSNTSGDVDPVLKNMNNQNSNNATSLPPSAFFQLPDIKPVVPTTSLSASLSPPIPSDRSAGRSVSISGMGTGIDRGTTAGSGLDGLHKRKAGLSHTVVEEEEEDDGEFSDYHDVSANVSKFAKLTRKKIPNPMHQLDTKTRGSIRMINRPKRAVESRVVETARNPAKR
jgi:hypothetical protein